MLSKNVQLEIENKQLKEEKRVYAIVLITLTVALFIAAIWANHLAINRVQPVYNCIHGGQCENK